MKTTRILLVAGLACLLVVGCAKNKDTSCHEEYAPAGATISWTDYNTTTALREYFYCHPKTIEQHAHDTVKVKGWVYIGNPNEGDAMMWSVREFIEGDDQGFLLTEDNNHNGYSKTFSVYVSNQEVIENFRSHFDDYFPKQLYIIGTIEFININYQQSRPCCYNKPRINAITIDTIP